MKKILSLTIIAASLWSSALLADVKIGVIDIQKVIQSAPRIKTIDSLFRASFQPREEKLKADYQKLQNDIAAVKRNASKMTEEQKSAAEDNINKERNNLQAAQAQFQQDIQDAQAKALQGILDQIKTVVNGIATKGHYDLILQSSSTVYYRPTYDITQQVVAALK